MKRITGRSFSFLFKIKEGNYGEYGLPHICFRDVRILRTWQGRHCDGRTTEHLWSFRSCLVFPGLQWTHQTWSGDVRGERRIALIIWSHKKKSKRLHKFMKRLMLVLIERRQNRVHSSWGQCSLMTLATFRWIVRPGALQKWFRDPPQISGQTSPTS